MTSPTVYEFGPFTNGQVDSGIDNSVQSRDLLRCENFDFSARGLLASRPSFSATRWTTAWGGLFLLGYYPSANVPIYFATNPVGGASTILGGNGAAITTGFTSSAGLAYGDVFFVFSSQSAGSHGGYVDSSLTWHSDANMPYGIVAAVVYGQRIFAVAANSTVYYTEPISPATPVPLTWNVATNFFTVGFKDGTDLRDIEIYNDSLLIFKDRSIWIFTYDSDPSQGSLQLLNSDIGVVNNNCVTGYENSLFILARDNVMYEMSNYIFTKINPLQSLLSDPAPLLVNPEAGINAIAPDSRPFIFAIVDSIIVRVTNASNGFATWVYYPKVNAWSKYTFATLRLSTFGRLVRVPNSDIYLGSIPSVITQGSNPTTWLIQVQVSNTDLYKTPDLYIESGVTTNLDFTAVLQTPFYTLDAPLSYKKLLHWGIQMDAHQQDALNLNGNLDSLAQALVHTKTHQQEFIHPQSTSGLAIASSDVDQLRFPGSVRFRRISFEVDFNVKYQFASKPLYVYYVFAVISVRGNTEDGAD